MVCTLLRRTVLSMVPMTLLCSGCACFAPTPAPTPEKVVLAGTWALAQPSTVNPNLTSLQLAFDDSGDLVTISFKLGSGAVASFPNVSATTDVVGTSVTINAVFGGNSIAFNGALSNNNTTMSGTTTTTLSNGSLVVTLPGVSATFNKIAGVS